MKKVTLIFCYPKYDVITDTILINKNNIFMEAYFNDTGFVLSYDKVSVFLGDKLYYLGIH